MSELDNNPRSALRAAQDRARIIACSPAYKQFIAKIREKFPWRFERIRPEVLDRDYLRIVDHHLRRLVPLIGEYITADTRRVLDFGCGSGGSAIALAMVYPNVHCYGTDIDPVEIQVAQARAELYGVPSRCTFQHVPENQPLPYCDGSFDFSQCSSVLEYVVAAAARRFCVEENVRLVAPTGLLFFSVPNRLYPYEAHTGKWGWNYFPKWTAAKIVDSSFWEVRRLARPAQLRLYRTPISRLFRPWSNFCVQKL
jgi:SAM-dependent methyltransferase